MGASLPKTQVRQSGRPVTQPTVLVQAGRSGPSSGLKSSLISNTICPVPEHPSQTGGLGGGWDLCTSIPNISGLCRREQGKLQGLTASPAGGTLWPQRENSRSLAGLTHPWMPSPWEESPEGVTRLQGLSHQTNRRPRGPPRAGRTSDGRGWGQAGSPSSLRCPKSSHSSPVGGVREGPG